MRQGLWVWPADQEGQAEILRRAAAAPRLMAALTAISKSEEGLSNAEVDDAISDSSEWRTLWAVRQLTSLGFIELKVDFFGNPARYRTTELGKLALARITGNATSTSQEPVPALQTASSLAPKAA